MIASTCKVVMSQRCRIIAPPPTCSRYSAAIKSNFGEGDAGVMAAKSIASREHEVDLSGTTLIGNVIQIAVEVGFIEVYRRRDKLVANCQYRNHGLNPTGRTEQMPVH